MQMRFFMTGEITLQYPNKVRILVIELQNRSKMESGVRSEKELSKAIAALLTLLSIDVYQLTWTKEDQNSPDRF